MRLAYLGLLPSAFLVVSAYGQSVISAHSGVVHYVEGEVAIENKPVDMKFGHFPEIKPNEVISTTEGRAEILLTPGSFLRLAENTSVKMVSNHLSDTRLELLSGEILVESVNGNKDSASALAKGNAITVTFKDSSTSLLKPGLYEFNAAASRMRVFDGEALVKLASGQLTLKKGRETRLEGALMAEKFEAKAGDELTRWSSRRSGYLATANVAAAQSLSSNGGMWNSYLGSGGWAYNPGFGMFTYVPMGGIAYSPFGYSFWSPYTVFNSPLYGYGYGYGYGSGYYGNGGGYSNYGYYGRGTNTGGGTRGGQTASGSTLASSGRGASGISSAPRSGYSSSNVGARSMPSGGGMSGGGGISGGGGMTSGASSAGSVGRGSGGGGTRGR